MALYVLVEKTQENYVSDTRKFYINIYIYFYLDRFV